MNIRDAPESQEAVEAPSSFAANGSQCKLSRKYRAACSTLPAGSRQPADKSAKTLKRERELTFLDQDHAGKAIIRVPQVN